MRKIKFKTMVIDCGEEVELIVDFADLGEMYSAIGRYGTELTKNMRSYVIDDKDGNEIYEGDKVRLAESSEIGVVGYGECIVTADDNYCGGSAMGHYLQLGNYKEAIGSTEYGWGNNQIVSSNMELVDEE